jgi:hypothetical protein
MEPDMINLKLGGVLLLAGAAFLLLSDTLLGNSDLASYSAFFGLILLPVGAILALVGGIQVAVARIRGRAERE